MVVDSTWLVQLKCSPKSLHNLQHDEGGNYMAETETEKVHKIIFFLLPGGVPWLAERQLHLQNTEYRIDTLTWLYQIFKWFLFSFVT